MYSLRIGKRTIKDMTRYPPKIYKLGLWTTEPSRRLGSGFWLKAAELSNPASDFNQFSSLREGLVQFVQSPDKQVMGKIVSLQFTPRPHDCKKVGTGFRVDQGEYRIFYWVDDDEQLVEIEVVGKRNDAEIYKMMRRIGAL